MRAEVAIGTSHCLRPGWGIGCGELARNLRRAVGIATVDDDVVPMRAGRTTTHFATYSKKASFCVAQLGIFGLILLHYEPKITIKIWYLIKIEGGKLPSARGPKIKAGRNRYSGSPKRAPRVD